MTGIQIHYQNSYFLKMLLARDNLSRNEWQQLEHLYDKVIRQILTDHQRESYGVSIIFCNNRFMREMNKRFRGIDAPTDVLSFTLEEEGLLGEIYLSAEYILRQETMKKKQYVHEVAYLIIHGALHLLGYVHDLDEQRARMEEVQEHYFLEFCEVYDGKTTK